MSQAEQKPEGGSSLDSQKVESLFDSLSSTYVVTRDVFEPNHLSLFDVDHELYGFMDIHAFSSRVKVAFGDRATRILEHLYSFHEITVDFTNSLASTPDPTPEAISPEKFFQHFFNPEVISEVVQMVNPVLDNQITQRRIIL